jgi:hypothetical protein
MKHSAVLARSQNAANLLGDNNLIVNPEIRNEPNISYA